MTLGPNGPAIAWGFDYAPLIEGASKITCRIDARHLNPGGIIHGGVLLTLLDEAGAIAGRVDPNSADLRIAVTVSLTSQFVGRASSGLVTATGTLMRRGHRLYFSRSEVTHETGELLAFGTSTHRYVGGGG